MKWNIPIVSNVETEVVYSGWEGSSFLSWVDAGRGALRVIVIMFPLLAVRLFAATLA